MPVYLLVEMPYDELQGWFQYFDKRPAGWQEDDRTVKLLQAQGVKEKPWVLFPNLKNIYNPATSHSDPSDTLKGSAFYKVITDAIGGDKIAI